MDYKNFFCAWFLKMSALFLLVPILTNAQVGSRTEPAASSTLPALVNAPVVGQTHDISFVGDVVEVKNDGTLVISPTPVGKEVADASSVGIININADTAQIIKDGRKKVPLSALAPGDHVQVKGKILPDGSYLGQHIQTVIKKTAVGKAVKQNLKSNVKTVKQKILQKSKKVVQPKNVRQKSKQMKKKIR